MASMAIVARQDCKVRLVPMALLVRKVRWDHQVLMVRMVSRGQWDHKGQRELQVWMALPGLKAQWELRG